jgi:dimethylargininase
MALVRIPASNLDEGRLTHRERVPVDTELADEQWDNYCAALVAEGWETLEIDAAPELRLRVRPRTPSCSSATSP